MLNATPFAVVADFYPAFATLDKFDHVEALGRVPTAIICGTEDKITSVGHSRKLHSRIPGSSLLECEGAGHMVLLERHKEVTAELDDLISLAQTAGCAVSLDVRRVGPEAAADVLAVVQEAFGARPVLDPPADALGEDVDSIARMLRAAAACSPTLDGEAGGLRGPRPRRRRTGAAPLRRAARRPGQRRRDRAGRGGSRRRARPRLRVVVLAREELPGTVAFWERARLRRDEPHQPLRRARAAAVGDRLRRTRRRDDARAGGAAGAQPASPATSSCSPASSGRARRPSPRDSAPACGVRGGVTSPTFVIARVHPSLVGGPDLVHVDAYRLGGLAELDDLDLDASLDEAVTVVEWGAGLAEALAESRLEVIIERGRGRDAATTSSIRAAFALRWVAGQ